MALSDKLLQFFETRKGETISGESLASRFEVSRNAVWKAINALKSEGHVFESSATGYSLSPDSGMVTASGIEKYLKTAGVFDVSVKNEVTSTNTELKKSAETGEKEFKVLVARSQTSGKGRQGRGFYSPAFNGIYFSVLLRPNLPVSACGNITALIGAAVKDTVKNFTDKAVGIKWVNDVFLDGKKISGILTEAEIDAEQGLYKYIVAGIGLNLTTPATGYGELDNVATSIFRNEKCNADTASAIIASILDNIYGYYIKLPDKDFFASYRENQILTGKEVDLIKNDEIYASGTVLGIDVDCALVVKHASGEIKTYGYGEARAKLK